MAEDKQCANDIYSQMNYEKVRQENLQKTEELYQKLLNDYSMNYSTYLSAQTSTASNPSDPTLQNSSDKSNLQGKPIIKDLNQKLIDIETALLDNNKQIRQSIVEQSKQLELDQKEKSMIEIKMTKLDKYLKSAQDNADTGLYGIKDLKTQYDTQTFWYHILLLINFVLFIIFVVIFYMKVFT